MFLRGDFADARSTAAAIETLKMKGYTAEDVTVFSTEPVLLPEGVLDRPSRMSLFAVAGAVTLCLLAAAFVYYTQHDYPLITGGMPLFSLWGTGVIFYEMTMLGAIGATFLIFLWESGLLRRTNSDPVPETESGVITLRVRCEPEHVAEAGECLYQAGALRVRKLEAAP